MTDTLVSDGEHELDDYRTRLEERIKAWDIAVENTIETDSSILAFGRRSDAPVVVKVIKGRADEWRSGHVLEAFAGRGVVRAVAHVAGAVLLERLTPGHSLASLVPRIADDDATATVADVIRRMSPQKPRAHIPSVHETALAFARHRRTAGARVREALVSEADRVFSMLSRSQQHERLLHGDLHHHNVLFDEHRGWLAVDPKGILGEQEYEAGAALRNPIEHPELFLDRSTIERRADRFARELNLNAARILAWTFAQAVLAVIWLVEDGVRVDERHPWVALADTVRSMLGKPYAAG